jgi:hypothetical protein
MAKTLVAVGIDPAGERIQPAGERPVGMDAATLPIEKDAGAVVVVAHAKHRAAGFGMLFDELRGRDAETPRQPQDFVSADANSLVVTAPGAGVAPIGKRAVARQRIIDVRQRILVRHDIASDAARHFRGAPWLTAMEG